MTRYETRHLDDGWTEIVFIHQRECDLRQKTIPPIAGPLHSRRIAYPYIDDLTRLNQWDEVTLDVGRAEFNVIDMALRAPLSRKVLSEKKDERVRTVEEEEVLLQWSILWPEGQPPPQVWR